MREERRLRVFENRVLRIIFGTKRDEGTKEWRKLRNEELNDLYSSHNNVIEKDEMGGASSTFGGEQAYTGFLLGEHKGKRTRGIPMRRWEDIIKMDFQELGCGGHGLDRAGSG
jgi:hypothetical protein